MNGLLARWKVDERQVRDRMYGASTARGRERWRAVWLVVRGWSATRGRDRALRTLAAERGLCAESSIVSYQQVVASHW